MEQNKVLILSGDYGDGHKQAANAIHEAAQFQENVETIVMDFMSLVHPLIHPISRYVFIQGVEKFPNLYGYLYQKTRYKESSRLLNLMNQVGIKKLIRYLEEMKPTSVVSTFPIAAAAMSLLKTFGLTDVHTVTVITDYTDHSYWIHPYTDMYIVGSEKNAKAINQLGIPESKIVTTGIPILPKFVGSHNIKMLKDKYSLNTSIPTIMVMGGGLGMFGGGLSSFLALDALASDFQMIIVTGRNVKLRERLTDKLRHSRHRMLIMGYVDNIHELMAISDLLITKPGGLTTSEAIASKLPMVLYNPLPGQEIDNAKYLLRAGVAMRAKDEKELVNKVERAVAYPELIQKMRGRTTKLNTKNAAYDAIEKIIHLRSYPTPQDEQVRRKSFRWRGIHRRSPVFFDS